MRTRPYAHATRLSTIWKAILLSVCGPQAYQLIKNLCVPEKPTDKTFAEIIQLVKDHVEPKPTVIVQRFTYHSRSRKQEESIAAYVNALKKISEHCQFGDTLQDMLRDRLVCGINDVRIQRRLLSEPDLTYKRAFDLAQAMEVAERNAQILLGQGSESIHIAQPLQPLMKDRIGNSEAEEVHFMKGPADKRRVQKTQEP